MAPMRGCAVAVHKHRWPVAALRPPARGCHHFGDLTDQWQAECVRFAVQALWQSHGFPLVEEVTMVQEQPPMALTVAAHTQELEALQDPMQAVAGCSKRLAPERPAGLPLEQVRPTASLERPIAAASRLTPLVPQLSFVLHLEQVQAVRSCLSPLVPEQRPAL